MKKTLPASSIEPVNVKVKGVAREIGSGDKTMLTFEVQDSEQLALQSLEGNGALHIAMLMLRQLTLEKWSCGPPQFLTSQNYHLW